MEDLNKKWKQVTLQTSVTIYKKQKVLFKFTIISTRGELFSLHMQPTTPLEHCEWLNKLLIEAWPNYIGPKLSLRFSSIVEVSTTLYLFLHLYIVMCAFCENAYILLYVSTEFEYSLGNISLSSYLQRRLKHRKPKLIVSSHLISLIG